MTGCFLTTHLQFLRKHYTAIWRLPSNQAFKSAIRKMFNRLYKVHLYVILWFLAINVSNSLSLGSILTDATTITCKLFIYCHYPSKAKTFDLNGVRQDCLQTRRMRGKKEMGKSKKGKKERKHHGKG